MTILSKVIPVSAAIATVFFCGCASFESTLEKANSGDAAAQFKVFKAYRDGNDVEKNATTALAWLEKAAAQNKKYRRELFLCYLENQRTDKIEYVTSGLEDVYSSGWSGMGVDVDLLDAIENYVCKQCHISIKDGNIATDPEYRLSMDGLPDAQRDVEKTKALIRKMKLLVVKNSRWDYKSFQFGDYCTTSLFQYGNSSCYVLVETNIQLSRIDKYVREAEKLVNNLSAEKSRREEKLAREQREREEKLAREQREREEKLAKEQREREEKLAKEQREREEKLAWEQAEKKRLEEYAKIDAQYEQCRNAQEKRRAMLMPRFADFGCKPSSKMLLPDIEPSKGMAYYVGDAIKSDLVYYPRPIRDEGVIEDTSVNSGDYLIFQFMSKENAGVLELLSGDSGHSDAKYTEVVVRSTYDYKKCFTIKTLNNRHSYVDDSRLESGWYKYIGVRNYVHSRLYEFEELPIDCSWEDLYRYCTQKELGKYSE